jgi:hypothetical protein
MRLASHGRNLVVDLAREDFCEAWAATRSSPTRPRRSGTDRDPAGNDGTRWFYGRMPSRRGRRRARDRAALRREWKIDGFSLEQDKKKKSEPARWLAVVRLAARAAARRVYSFGALGTDGDKSLRDLLGGKGANLAEMCRMGLPVPPGFTISTEVCTHFVARGGRYPRGSSATSTRRSRRMSARSASASATPHNPLLVSCDRGAPSRCPG